MRNGTFIYDGHIPVDYVCQHDQLSSSCSALCTEVSAHMIAWHSRMPGQSKVRIAKRNMMMDPTQQPNLKRLLNE